MLNNISYFKIKKEVIITWREIPEWEGLYSVNENGEVKNLKTNKLLIGDINNAGYYRVCLY